MMKKEERKKKKDAFINSPALRGTKRRLLL
jgi:hypothetical protein